MGFMMIVDTLRTSLWAVCLLGGIVGCGRNTPVEDTGPTETRSTVTRADKRNSKDDGAEQGDTEFASVVEDASASRTGQSSIDLPSETVVADDGTANNPRQASARTVSEADELAAVRLQTLDWPGVQELVARHTGRVVLVDIWTTTCTTCVEEFPKFVALQEEYGRERVACVSVNCDYDGIATKPPEYYRPRVLKFLQKQQAAFDNVLLNMAFLDFLDTIDLSSTPAVLVYDRQGKLRYRFDHDDFSGSSDEFTMVDVKTLVDRLLAE